MSQVSQGTLHGRCHILSDEMAPQVCTEFDANAFFVLFNWRCVLGIFA